MHEDMKFTLYDILFTIATIGITIVAIFIGGRLK